MVTKNVSHQRNENWDSIIRLASLAYTCGGKNETLKNEAYHFERQYGLVAGRQFVV